MRKCRPQQLLRSVCTTTTLKFIVFVVFTSAYCYVSYNSMPPKPTRPTISRHRNATKTLLYVSEPVFEMADAEEEMAWRRETVYRVCQEQQAYTVHTVNAWEYVIDSRHGLIWCNVFKAASSAWMYNFNLLGGYSPEYLRSTNKNPITLLRSRFPRPTPSQLIAALPDSVSFLIVRDPFERLLSAYRNKMERVAAKYYRQLARSIIARYRDRLPDEPTAGPSFREFVQYVTEGAEGKADEHWAPVQTFCTPCAVNFSAIAKLETLSRDQEYIVQASGLDTAIPRNRLHLYNTGRGAVRTRDLLPRYFSQLTTNLLDKLAAIYHLDFQLFGYNVTKYYAMLEPSLT